MKVEQKKIEISKIKSHLENGDKVEVLSPDGWVEVNDFVDKGTWEEYVLYCDNKEISCNENHLFETTSGWFSARQIVIMQTLAELSNERFSGFSFLTEDGYYKNGYIERTGKEIPIVDIQVNHENHRYYTEGVSSHNTGVGKSLAMCHFASAMLAQGKNVLYITMEMAEEKIAERIDANLFDVDISDLRSLDQREFDTKIHDIQSKTNGRLVIKEYPTSQAHTGHFRALLDDLNRKKSFVPDCIFVDYLNICASSRMKGVGGSVNSYTFIKAIAEEIRGLAVERDVPIWTATQTNREGYGNSDVDLTNTSESFGLPATADLMVAMITTEELDDLDQVLVKQLKNRYNDPTYYKKFVLGIDRAKMRLYDVEDNAQSNLQTEVNEYTQQSPTSSDFVDWTTV